MNQLLVEAEGEMFDWRQVGRDCMGGYHPIVWGNKWNDKKINKITYIVVLDGCRLMILHTTINQKTRAQRKQAWRGGLPE
jgi:hypothetical protein